MSRAPHGWRLILPLIAAASLAMAGCSAKDVTAFRLQHDAEQVQSLAADGALLAQGVEEGDLTGPFVRVHAGELAAEATRLREVLASAEPGPARADATAAVVRLSGRVATRLDELGRRSGDRAAAAAIRADLEGVARRAERIAGAAS
jgi:hypothetical protein